MVITIKVPDWIGQIDLQYAAASLAKESRKKWANQHSHCSEQKQQTSLSLNTRRWSASNYDHLQLFELDNEWLRGDLITAPGTIEHLAAWHRSQRWGRPQSRSPRPPPSPSWTPPSPPHPPSPWLWTTRRTKVTASPPLLGTVSLVYWRLAGLHSSSKGRTSPPPGWCRLRCSTSRHVNTLFHLSICLCLCVCLCLCLCRCLSYTCRQPFATHLNLEPRCCLKYQLDANHRCSMWALWRRQLGLQIYGSIVEVFAI